MDSAQDRLPSGRSLAVLNLLLGPPPGKCYRSPLGKSPDPSGMSQGLRSRQLGGLLKSCASKLSQLPPVGLVLGTGAGLEPSELKGSPGAPDVGK